ncbi:sentrin-specific protease 1-like isoform X3 [Aphis gossypii]|uniref:sentrin-specific protease 1-like isoform X3 n=1 Tax=Aphis gossypii TaxID=80765 RepID=UPI002158BD44|nr:sentrin-specific protease 1-like isoform X3 [Aphis gossypii]
MAVEERGMATSTISQSASPSDFDDCACLDDKYINKYMNLITIRSGNNVYVFDTFFFTALSEKGYSRVHRWTKNIDIFSKQKLMIPIYIKEENCWCLVLIDMTKNVLKYYDKSGKYDPKHIRLIVKYLKLEHVMRKGEFLKTQFTESPIKIFNSDVGILDCGLFICVIAEHLSRNARLLFTLKDMRRFHKQILCDLTCDSITCLNSSYTTNSTNTK